MHGSAVERASSPQLKKVCTIPSGVFDHHGPLLIGWLSKSITVSPVCYGETFEYLSLTVKAKRSCMLSRGLSPLCKNHSWKAATVLVGSSSTSTLQSELSPYDCHVFKPMKKAHEDHCFDMDAGVQKPITLWFHWQPQDFYRHGIGRLMKLWVVCLNNCCAYVE